MGRGTGLAPRQNVDAKDRWQALQAQLARAQDCLRAGDRAGALAAIDSALAIDPNFLAAHALRERTIADVGLIASPTSKPLAAPQVQVRPLVSAEGYAQFEQRARRRRVDRRLDAARAAIAEGRRKDAAEAIEEIRELDPHLPELPELTVAFASLPVPTQRPSGAGRWLAAAAVFGTIVLGATWLQESGALGSRSIVAVAPLVSPPQPLSVTLSAAEAHDASADTATGTAGDVPSEIEPVPPPRPVASEAVVAAAPPPPPALNIPLVSPAVVTAAPPPTIPAVAAAVSAPNPASAPAPLPVPAATTASAPPAASAVVPDDSALVQQTLQRYRSAYEGLDARSARAIWPAVNESALARAFDGLQSQSLTFDTCDVQLRGEAAAAICRGTTRYVPKVGSRDPRTEARVWNFTLRKRGAGWMIESARAER